MKELAVASPDQLASAKAKYYAKTFNEEFELAQEVYRKQFKKDMNEHELAALGEYLNNWRVTQEILESDGTTRQTFGELPKISLGLVALQYATLPASFLASVQPIDEEIGVVYYRTLVATSTRGGVNRGDVLGNDAGGLTDISKLDSYYGEHQVLEQAIDPLNPTLNLSLAAPVRPGSVEVEVRNASGDRIRVGAVTADGVIVGQGFSGTVNFDTGAATVTFTDTTGLSATDVLHVEYDQNLVQASETPGFFWDIRSKAVRAHYHVLQTSYSLLAEIGLKRRFGRMLEQDVVTDIIAQINGAVLSRIIKELRLAANTYSDVLWDETIPPGVSAAEHRLTFNDALDTAAQLIDEATGVGGITALVVGSKARIVLRSLGMEIESKKVTGPYFLGYYQGLPVIYAPTNILPPDEAIAVFRGQQWLDSPVVYAPYLPITVARGVVGQNVMNQATAAAHAAAVTRVQDKFAVRIRIYRPTP